MPELVDSLLLWAYVSAVSPKSRYVLAVPLLPKRESTKELIPSCLCTQIYESAPEIAEVGAGIQVAPNFCRVLDGFGVLEELKKQVSRPPSPKTQYRRQQLILYLIRRLFASSVTLFVAMPITRSSVALRSLPSRSASASLPLWSTVVTYTRLCLIRLSSSELPFVPT